MGYRATGKLANFGRTAGMEAAARRTTERVGQELLERTMRHTPVAKPPPGHEEEWLQSRHGRLPGTLRESWKVGDVTVIERGHTYSVEVYTMDRIAPYVEWPTMPHIIVPHNPSGMLRFWDRLGRTVYARIVMHTGTKGSYMLTTSLAEVAAMWETIGAEEMERWAREHQAAI